MCDLCRGARRQWTESTSGQAAGDGGPSQGPGAGVWAGEGEAEAVSSEEASLPAGG